MILFLIDVAWMKDKYKVIIESKAEKFLDSLVEEQKIPMLELVGMLEILGYELSMPYSRKVNTPKNTIYELRCHKFGNRLYYYFHGKEIYVITNGGKKNTQKKILNLLIN
ncbi:type II toxin-antitoxin system RelE/ParE family toxin [Thiotrichales bacterium 19S3-7]|nr:type II toxin-antitoxin system RelE/ParE family toxin [Thiotrichales bacterium 19S3-7]MCF6802590.1 type II toxin-antitoxin system RelE/ParE family toxin [Thiotrichales bacterium 19S3-11]